MTKNISSQNTQQQTNQQTAQARPSIDSIKNLSKDLTGFSQEMKDFFREREYLVDMTVYALLMREHVLIFGAYGTGKSEFTGCVFEAIQGERNFAVTLNKFMNESHIIGTPDVKKMREEGKIIYNAEGGLLEAHLLELNEIFDSNGPLLRTLLDILNERQFKRGFQHVQADLRSAFATTNGNPEKIIREYPELDAVIDRFILQTNVNYINEKENRLAMYARNAKRERISSSVQFDQLDLISSYLCSGQVEIPSYILESYDDILEDFTKQTSQVISDRRKCKVLGLIQADALKNGTDVVDPENLLAIRWGLCKGHDKDKHETFMKIAEPHMEKAKSKRTFVPDLAEIRLFEEWEAKIPSLPKTPNNDELVKTMRALEEMANDIKKITPKLPTTQTRQVKLLERVEKTKSDVLHQICNNPSI